MSSRVCSIHSTHSQPWKKKLQRPAVFSITSSKRRPVSPHMFSIIWKTSLSILQITIHRYSVVTHLALKMFLGNRCSWLPAVPLCSVVFCRLAKAHHSGDFFLLTHWETIRAIVYNGPNIQDKSWLLFVVILFDEARDCQYFCGLTKWRCVPTMT